MTITGAEYVILTLGGLTKVSNLIGKPVTTIQGWKDRSQIPQKHWDSIIEAANSIDVELTYLDFCQMHTLKEHIQSSQPLEGEAA